ncbi:ubiquitinyl hydrolase 1 [Malassezia obtusa]|uniref:ubiquitinyl hydrolase 1 n=1 Tax=Malassezia obtusa TaxID=76774 RepID=A0AAF0IQM1_9BASI|nr:ubiquitinyl hydrolase 1 [Malassezia obtusa]
MPDRPLTGIEEPGTRPEARTSVLDRFKRARTTSPDTDCSSTDAETSDRTAYTPAPSHLHTAVDDEEMEHKHDEAVDSLLRDPVLQLNDGRTDPLVADVQRAKAAAPRLGETWYIVPARWFHTFTTDTGAAPSIDTTGVSVPGTQRLRPGALEGVDYELVPRSAWDALLARFGLRGPALPCAVIAGAHASHPPRVELFPPTLDLLRIGTPTGASSGVPSITLSAASTLGKLKAQTRAMLALRVEDADLRFVRVPDALRTRAEAQGGVVAEEDVRTAVPAPEAVDGAGSATLSALQLDAPHSVLAVDVRTDGRWQVNLGAARVLRSSTGAGAARGLRGLVNLGNTCFMNSALQCLSNTPELQRYFLHEVHWEEINTENPLGMGGAIAGAFGRLMQQLWGAHSGAVVPREFKTALARFAPQFTGYAQQDSQELLAFLLDGLHEDLNRILKKPYIEAPDWPGGSDRDMVRFAQQQWDIYKARNDSLIVDLFQGQYRSTLVCPVCDKVSIKFDPFMYLTLPIPNTRKWRGRVFVVPHDTTQPITQLDVQLPATATIAHLREKAAALLGLHAKTLAVGEVWSHHVYRWLADYEPVRDVSAGDYIYLWEQPTPFTFPAPLKKAGRFGFFKSATRAIEDLEKSFAPPAVGDTVTLPVYSCLAPDAASASRFGTFRRTLGEGFGLPFFVTLSRADAAEADAVRTALAQQYARFSKHPDDDPAAFWQRADAAPKSDGAAADAPACTVRFAVPPSDESVHRGDEATEHTTERLDERLRRLAGADAGAWPALYTGGALICLWEPAVAEALFDPVPSSHVWGPVREAQDPDFARSTAQLAEGRRRTPKLQLDDCLDEFTRAEQLGEDDLWYCPSCKEFRQATKKFDLWKVPDILVVHLKRFSAGRMARDKLDNLIDFPITGLDLRSRVVGSQLIRELQLEAPPSTTVGEKFSVPHDANDDAVEADEPIYDLYAVDNHFGGLGGGHYTAFAKNPEDGRWYNYDDSSVRPVSDPETVKSSAAYLLFYRRRTSRAIGGKTREKTDAMAKSDAPRTARPPPATPATPSYLGNTPLPPSDDDSSDEEPGL